MKLKSLRLLLWICPFSLTAEDDEDEEEEEVVEEEECWGPCWSSDSESCRRSNCAKSVGADAKSRSDIGGKKNSPTAFWSLSVFFFLNAARYLLHLLQLTPE